MNQREAIAAQCEEKFLRALVMRQGVPNVTLLDRLDMPSWEESMHATEFINIVVAAGENPIKAADSLFEEWSRALIENRVAPLPKAAFVPPKDSYPGFERLCGLVLRKLRQEVGLTGSQLARLIGVKAGFIYRIESGRQRIGFVTYMDIVEAIGKDPSEVLGELLREYFEPETESDQ